MPPGAAIAPSVHPRQAGFTLIELLGAIVLLCVIVLTALQFQTRAAASTESQKVLTALSSLTGKLRESFRQQGNYAGLAPRMLYDLGLVAPPFRWDGTNVIDPWGNAVTLSAAPSGAAPSFVITVGGATGRIHSSTCGQIMYGLAEAADQITAGFNVTHSNGVVTQGTWVKSKTTPFMPSRVGFACAGADPLVIALQFH